LQHGRVVPIKSRLVLLDYYVLGSIGGRRRWAAGGGGGYWGQCKPDINHAGVLVQRVQSEYMRRHSDSIGAWLGECPCVAIASGASLLKTSSTAPQGHKKSCTISVARRLNQDLTPQFNLYTLRVQRRRGPRRPGRRVRRDAARIGVAVAANASDPWLRGWVRSPDRPVMFASRSLVTTARVAVIEKRLRQEIVLTGGRRSLDSSTWAAGAPVHMPVNDTTVSKATARPTVTRLFSKTIVFFYAI